MRKLAHSILMAAAAVLVVWLLPEKLGFPIPFPLIIHTGASILGAAAIVVGIFKFVLSVFYTSNKSGFYQGTFCILLGISVAFFNLWAFIGAVSLLIWLDHKKQPLL